jgi:hypothetical protein
MAVSARGVERCEDAQRDVDRDGHHLIVSGLTLHKKRGRPRVVLAWIEDDDQRACRNVDLDKLLAKAHREPVADQADVIGVDDEGVIERLVTNGASLGNDVEQARCST